MILMSDSQTKGCNSELHAKLTCREKSTPLLQCITMAVKLNNLIQNNPTSETLRGTLSEHTLAKPLTTNIPEPMQIRYTMLGQH